MPKSIVEKKVCASVALLKLIGLIKAAIEKPVATIAPSG